MAQAAACGEDPDMNDVECTMPILEKNGRFSNPWETWHQPSAAKFLYRVILTEKNRSNVPKSAEELNKHLPIVDINFEDIQKAPEEGVQALWIGHASVLVQFDNISVITDPQFSTRSGPIQWVMGVKRYRNPPCQIADLPAVDAVFISHSHYDHLDVQSCRQLENKFSENGLRWFVPKGLKLWMCSTLGVHKDTDRITELNWWEESSVTDDESDPKSKVKVVFTPAQHWCKRTINDDNTVLWGSWSVLGPKHRFFFTGDTGYCKAFKEIGRKYGPFDLAAIPIGAYEPRWFMSPQHVDPAEAVKIHQDIKCRHSIGIHWGTFTMTYEPYLEPRDKLKEEVEKAKLTADTFVTLKHGEVRLFPDQITDPELDIGSIYLHVDTESTNIDNKL